MNKCLRFDTDDVCLACQKRYELYDDDGVQKCRSKQCTENDGSRISFEKELYCDCTEGLIMNQNDALPNETNSSFGRCIDTCQKDRWLCSGEVNGLAPAFKGCLTADASGADFACAQMNTTAGCEL